MGIKTHRFLQIVLFFHCILITMTGKSQPIVEQQLIHSIEQAPTDSARFIRMGFLADYFFAIKNFSKADSLIESRIMLAEKTTSPGLILRAYFDNAGYNSTGTSTVNRLEITKQYIDRAMAYAKANNLNDYIAMAHANLASLNATEGLLDQAITNASTGYTSSLNTDNDSAKVVCSVELGNIYLEKLNILTAYRTFINAQNIAVKHKDESLLATVYIALAKMYKKLGKDELAKLYINKSRAIHDKLHRQKSLINDYIILAKLSNYTAAKQYLQQAIDLSTEIQSFSQKIEAERILFSYILVREKPDFVNEYLQNHEELKNLFLNTGPDYLNWMQAEIYLYGGLPAQALPYFKKAENSFNSGYDLTTKKNFFSELAYCLREVNNIPEAIKYNLKSMDIAKASSDLNGMEANAKELKELYQQKANYKLALEYGNLYDSYKDSVNQLGKERDLAVLEIENEAAAQERQEQLQAAALRRKYNLQYMFITIVVVTVFILLIMVGMFKVSTLAIRVMGFLSLIFLFEFIILVLDQKIHHLTHGEPWKIWLIKIGIISFLLPLHHYLEHKLIRYLLSRHLITVRSRISFSNLLKKKKRILSSEKKEES